MNTNTSALAALASLRKINSDLSVANKQIQTGYRVADAYDDASTFSVAQGLRGNLQAYAAVQASLANGVGVGSVTQAALTGISDIVGNLEAKVTQLADGSISAAQRAIYTVDYNSLTSQITNFISQANYNGTNLLSAGSSSKTFLSDVSANTLSLSSQSSVDAAFTTFNQSSVSSASAATLALTSLTTFQSAVATSLGQNASESRGLSLQSTFTNTISDSITIGIGALVDADIGKASAAVQALQVRQQLAIQSLAIANQQPSRLLGLFPSLN
ncbi:MAG: flagellin [Proteobacteria bacterium]|nr:flagellin [Pseudomonadota bacterium]